MPRATSQKTTKTNARTTKARKTKTSNLLKSLPESVEHIEIVQQVAGVLEELQHRVIDVKEEASKELKKLMKRYESNYKTLEKKVHQVTSEAKRQAQTSMIHLLQKWHEHKEKLPTPLANEIEKIISHVGTRMMTRPSEKRAKKTATATAKKTSASTTHKRKTATTKKAKAAKTRSPRTIKAKSTDATTSES